MTTSTSKHLVRSNQSLTDPVFTTHAIAATRSIKHFVHADVVWIAEGGKAGEMDLVVPLARYQLYTIAVVGDNQQL